VKRLLTALVLFAISAQAVADVTLECDLSNRCDGFVKNCVNEPYSFTVTVIPESKTVVVGSKTIVADFSNQAIVSFTWTGYMVHVNRYEYSAMLFNKDEVRSGSCRKIDPAW
jgi:hypothetical protein